MSLLLKLLLVHSPYGFGSNPTFLWAESHHFNSSSRHQFLVNSDRRMWNLNGSSSLLWNRVFFMVKSPVVIVRAPLFMFIYPSSGEITMLKMCSLSIFRNLHIFGGYYSPSSAFQHFVHLFSMLISPFLIVFSHGKSPGLTSQEDHAKLAENFTSRLREVASLGGELSRGFPKNGGSPKKATLDGSW